MHKYTKEVTTVWDGNDIPIGYVCRARLMEVSTEISENTFWACRDLKSGNWKGGFKNRKEARIFLENSYTSEKLSELNLDVKLENTGCQIDTILRKLVGKGGVFVKLKFPELAEQILNVEKGDLC